MDRIETVSLLVLPALVVGVVVSALSGAENFVAGVAIGGLFGAILAGLRRGFVAVQTSDGIERRQRPTPDDTVWARLADVKYDPRYDRVLTVLLFGIAVVAFGAIPFVNPQNSSLIVRLVIVGFFGLVSALVSLGASRATDR
jgi:fructose-specific phosphotransferase system IIC component